MPYPRIPGRRHITRHHNYSYPKAMHTIGTTFPVSAPAAPSPPPEPTLFDEPAAPTRHQQQEELLSLAMQVETWRIHNGFSMRQLFKRARVLNDKTHGKLVAGDLSGLIAANHLPKYRQAVRDLNATEQQQTADPILPDLTPTRLVNDGVASLRLQMNLERFMLVEGDSGSGKSTALSFVAGQDADAMLVCAHEGWARPLQAITDLLNATGFSGAMPNGFSARHQALIKRLADKPRLLCIDEGQHIEIRILNVLKDIINRTGCRVVVATMASLWRKIQTKHWPEVQQLLFNRMHLRIPLLPPDAGDVKRYLCARLRLALPEAKRDAESWSRAFGTIATSARSHGGMAFVRKVAAAARLFASAGGEELGPEHLVSASSEIASNTRGFDR